MKIDEKYIELGLIALARSGEKTVFTGHYGAALLAAYFMDQENELSDAVRAGLERNCNHYREKHAEFFVPFEEGAVPDERLMQQIVEGIEFNLQQLRSSAHGVILGVLALKGLRLRPDLCTAPIVDGISRTLKRAVEDRGNRYYGIEDYREFNLDQVWGIPRYQSIQDMIEVSLAECRFAAPDQKIGESYHFFSGELEHGVTFAHALVDLNEMGLSHLTEKGMEIHRLQMFLNRQRPEEILHQVVTRPRYTSLLDERYWENIFEDPHGIKVPYAALALLKKLPEEHRTTAELYVCKLLDEIN